MIEAGRTFSAGRGLFSAGLLLVLCSAAAASTSWDMIGPEGGSIRALAVNPKNPAEIFIATSGRPALIFRTTDGAKSWRRVAVVPEGVFDIAVDSVNPAVVYALGVSSVFRSADHGASWTGFAQPVGSAETGGAIIAPPGEAGVLYAAGRKGQLAVAKSTDWGETWTLCNSGISPHDGYAVCAAVNPKSGRHILVGGFSDGGWRIYRTMDGGQTWAAAVCAFKPLDLAFDPFNPLKALAVSAAGVHQTTDGGGAWTRLNLLVLNRLAADPLAADKFYGGFNNSSYQSRDGGKTWSGTYDTKMGSCTGLEVSGGQLCFSSNRGVFIVPTSGGTWQFACTGLRTREVVRAAISPAAPNIIFLTDKDDSLFRSDDFGDTWALVTDLLQGASLTGMFITPAWPLTLYMASLNSVDCGSG